MRPTVLGLYRTRLESIIQITHRALLEIYEAHIVRNTFQARKRFFGIIRALERHAKSSEGVLILVHGIRNTVSSPSSSSMLRSGSSISWYDGFVA